MAKISSSMASFLFSNKSLPSLWGPITTTERALKASSFSLSQSLSTASTHAKNRSFKKDLSWVSRTKKKAPPPLSSKQQEAAVACEPSSNG